MICLKVSEEAAELVKATTKEKNKGRIAEESADLLYYLMVLLVNEGLEFSDVLKVLKERTS